MKQGFIFRKRCILESWQESGSRTRGRLKGFVLCLALLLPFFIPGTTRNRIDSADSRIVFVSERDGIEDIYTMKSDGSDVRRITVTKPVDGEQRGSWVPCWSPDRTRIVFASNRDDGGSANLYVVDSDGFNLRRLTEHDGFDYVPDWSPDGTHIVFLSDRDGFYELYSIEPDGSNVRRLTYLEMEEGRLCCPDWSTDGRRIVFGTRNQPMTNFIRILDLESGNVSALQFGTLPRWSPDGERIAFWGPNRQVWMMQSDGLGAHQVTSLEGMSNYPVWSPDGEWIAFNNVPATGEFSDFEMFKVRADGTELIQLTDNDAFDAHANWW